MPKFRKKPVVIEAVQIREDNAHELIAAFVPNHATPMVVLREEKHPDAPLITTGVEIQTKEGLMTAGLGWWVIRGIAGELYPCDPDIFAATYEPAADDSSLG